MEYSTAVNTSGSYSPSIFPQRIESKPNFDRLNELYALYWSDLCRYLKSRFGSISIDPEDVAQSVFLKLAELDNVSHIENEKSFIFRMASNYIIDYHRSPKSLVVGEDNSSARYGVQPLVNHISPEQSAISQEELGIVESVINGLSPRDREFVLLNRVDGLSYTEIAKRAGMSRSGVQKVIMQALSNCLDALEED